MSDPTAPTPLRFRFTYDELSALFQSRLRAVREARGHGECIAKATAQDDNTSEAVAEAEANATEFQVDEEIERLTRLHKHLVRGNFYELTAEEYEYLFPTLRV